MPAPPSLLILPGRVFWRTYPGTRGGGKRRPMVVVSSRADVIRERRLIAVVCTTDFEEPIPSNCVRLPHNNGAARSITQLPEPTVAVCDWKDVVPVGEIVAGDFGGIVPTDKLREICAKAGKPFPSQR